MYFYCFTEQSDFLYIYQNNPVLFDFCFSLTFLHICVSACLDGIMVKDVWSLSNRISPFLIVFTNQIDCLYICQNNWVLLHFCFVTKNFWVFVRQGYLWAWYNYIVLNHSFTAGILGFDKWFGQSINSDEPCKSL